MGPPYLVNSLLIKIYLVVLLARIGCIKLLNPCLHQPAQAPDWAVHYSKQP
ncbi:uncharacterized protein METZ01_LOCUS479018, partial [marine metagenome]